MMTTIKTFNAESTTDEVLDGVDLSGKRILVTGVSAGLGVETARVLASHGAQVVGTVRDLEKGRRATKIVVAEAAGGGGLELVQLDLGSLASVRACADALVADGRPFDVIIANAGVMACPKGLTIDGFETQFGTNHLGHFLLINRLAPLLKKGSRVVVLSSGAHASSVVNLEDPNFERTPYTEFEAYGRSKTANVLFAVEFDRRHKDRGVRATAVHPGMIATELGRHLTPAVLQVLNDTIEAARKSSSVPMFMKSSAQGAATSVWSAIVAPADAVGGRYCEDCHVAEIQPNDSQVAGGVRAFALNPDTAKALWAKSEEMVGETF